MNVQCGFINSQVEFCDVLVLNKTDLVTNEALDKLEHILRTLQPDAKIIKTTQSQVDINDVLDTGRFDFEKASNSAGWIKELTEGGHEAHTPETERIWYEFVCLFKTITVSRNVSMIG